MRRPFCAVGLVALLFAATTLHAATYWKTDFDSLYGWGTYRAAFTLNTNSTATLTENGPTNTGKAWYGTGAVNLFNYGGLHAVVAGVTGKVCIAISGPYDGDYQEYLTFTNAGEGYADISQWAGNTNDFYVQLVLYGEGASATLDSLDIHDDSDADGMPDPWERQYFATLTNGATGDVDSDALDNVGEYEHGTNPTNTDTDADTIQDGEEVYAGADGYVTDPLLVDTDGDTLTDPDEVNVHGTDPSKPDTDDDGMPDGWELAKGFNPKVADGTGDADGDYLSNADEYANGADPHDSDTDDDSLPDAWEVTYGHTPNNNPWDDSARLLERSSCAVGNYVWGMQTASSLLYVAGAWHAAIVDVGDPTNPVVVATCTNLGGSEGIDVQSGLAFTAQQGEGLYVTDVSDPANPLVLSTSQVPQCPEAVCVVSGVAYVADWAYGLRIIGVTNPAAPVGLATYDTSGYAFDVAVESNVACVADYHGGLVLLDVTHPDDPIHLSTFSNGVCASAVAVKEGIAYLADDLGLQVIDIQDPASPTCLATVAIAYGAHDVAIGSNMVYVSRSAPDGLLAVDVSVPSTPRTLCFSPPHGPVVHAAGDTVYAGDGVKVYIMELQRDGDGDGMPDAWEIETFGTTTNARNGDADGDGLSNWGEYTSGLSPTNADSDGDGMDDGAEVHAGMDPSDPESVLAATARFSAGAGEVHVIRWPSVAGHAYGVWWSTNLMLGFGPLATNIPATPPENSYSNAVSDPGPYYYKVRAE